MSAAITTIDLSQLDLLVIDDNRFIRQLLTEILRSFGANTIRESDCSEDALRQMDRKVPDLIFCDWMMGPVSGLKFLQSIRSAGGPQRVPVIMISGHATNEHVSAALGEGADSYIVKPFKPATLMAHLIQVISATKNEYLLD